MSDQDEIERLRAIIRNYDDALDNMIYAHEQVVMDTDEDRDLHDRLCRAQRVLLTALRTQAIQ